jgi:uncharacterized cupredoxin-like copper-binding protein
VPDLASVATTADSTLSVRARPGRWGVRAVALTASLALLAVLALYQVAQAAPQTVEIRIHYSQFEPSTATVQAGHPVTFVIRNEDPIEHEWIVGDEAVHEVHRTGTEAHHGARPTEISLAALESRSTTITFDRPGRVLYICHLPGHEAYGMVGVLEVR